MPTVCHLFAHFLVLLPTKLFEDEAAERKALALERGRDASAAVRAGICVPQKIGEHKTAENPANKAHSAD